MARTVGPLFSVSASGKFAKALVFATWKGRAYVRQLVTPANPRSAGQTGIRAMMKFLAPMWHVMAAPAKASWEEAAAARSISPFNQFTSENMNRWKQAASPTLTSPAAETSAPLTISAHTYTGGAAHATLSMTPSAATDLLAIAIFRATAEITLASRENCIAVVPHAAATPLIYIDAALPPGTYHYRCAAMNVDGIQGTVLADATAVVT